MHHRTNVFLLIALSTLTATGCELDPVVVTTSAAAGKLELSAPSIDFGMAECGGDEAGSQTVTLKNNGNAALRWSASLDSSGYFDLVGVSKGSIAPDEEATITVRAGAMPSNVAAGTVIEGALRIRTNDSLQTQIQVPVTATALGATFELVAPALADFGTVPVGVDAPPIALTLKNVGNAPAAVSIVSPDDPQFSFGWGDDEGVDVDPGESLSDFEAHFRPASTKASSSAGIVSVKGAVCGQSASTIPVKGQGLAGVVGVSPGAVDFGKVGCNSQADPYTFVIYNGGNEVFTWEAAVGEGAPFSLSESVGSVSPGGVSEVLLIPDAIGMTDNLEHNGFGTTLTITTDVEHEAPRELPVVQTAAGAILALSPESLTVPGGPLFKPGGSEPVTVTNHGNLDVEVTVEGDRVAASPGSGKVTGGGGTLVASVSFVPDAFGPIEGSVSVSTDGPICQPLPTPVAATGSGDKVSALAISVGGMGPHTNSGRVHYGQGGCAILADSGGRVACWGTNEYGQLGTTGHTDEPVIVPGLKGVVSISSGGDYNCAVDGAGDVWCWGNNRNRKNNRVGKLGVTNIDSTATPVKVPGVVGATQVSCGHNVTCARTKEGSVFCWGTGKRGMLGNGSDTGHNRPPQLVSSLQDVVEVQAGSGGACALRSDGRVYCWGRWEHGTLGNGSSSGEQALPTQVALTDVVTFTNQTGIARHGPRCALNSSGNAYCWGAAAQGQLGNGTNNKNSVNSSPGGVSGISGATAIAGYYNGGCVLMADKTVRCWGRNQFGQVGDGSTNIRTTPVTVSGINDASAIEAGGKAACAIVTGGSVKCWGDYGSGTSTTPQTLKYF